MKVLYISNPIFLDLDLSLISHLSKKCDVYYLMDLPPYYLKSSALNLNSQMARDGIFNGNKIKELRKFKKYIPVKKFYVINRTSSKMLSFSNIKLQNKLIQFIDDLNPDIIHCGHLLNRNFLYFLFKNKRKIAVTVHDPLPHSGEESHKNSIIRKINYLFIKNIILLNKNQKEKFISSTNFFKFKNIFDSSLGIYEYLKDYKSIVSKSDTFNILFFGRITSYKGIDDLLNAFILMEKPYPNIKLIIAGRGKFWFDISPYQLNPKILFLNRFIPNEELVQLINNANLVVCPYKDATQSGVVMSAFALNTPVLATRTGGLPEMIEDGKTGFLVPPLDTVALSNKLKKIIEEEGQLKKLELNIKNKYATGLKSWDMICENLIQDYLKILS